MSKPEIAINYFEQGFNCSQSVLSAFSKEFDVPENELLKIATAFGGGLGRRQLTCGAVSGALMALGLHFGRGKEDEASKKTLTYEKAEAFMKEFEKRNGSITCRDLLRGLNMHDPADMQKINDLNLFKTSCYQYAKDAVDIVQDMIKKQ
jgi:C_GCAxxG_C_C family probable redox protein